MTVSELLHGFATRYRGFRTQRVPIREELPLRSELFSADQMELYGGILAASHELSSGRGTDQLLARLDENESKLFAIGKVLTEAAAADQLLTPAGEWLYDNFYLIEEQIRLAKRHLPKSYSRELPLLANGTSAGLPRVYDIALQAVSHGDGRVDTESLRRFVSAYQGVANLRLGELWAIPIMLRLSLIENLRRVGVHVAAGRVDRSLADSWADEITRVADKDPKSLVLVIADMARSDPPMTTSFISEMARRLQGQGPSLALPLTWIEQRLAESNQTIDQMVQLGNQQQAADQVSISNSIHSLRTLGAIDWREFVEAISIVERTLREDPLGIYGRMDFSSRDRYRHAVERLAKASPLSEVDVARQALRLAREAEASGHGNARAHVGFYLIDSGLSNLETAAQVHFPVLERFFRVGRRYPLPSYLGPIALITLALTATLVTQAHAEGANGLLLGLLAVLSLLAMSQVAVALVNWIASLLVTPHSLPRMDFSKGIPREFRTLVVVPTILSDEAEVNRLVEALEVKFLANQDNNLSFALLSDFRDSAQEKRPEDDSLLRLAQTSIEALNKKYADRAGSDDTAEKGARATGDGGDPFFLFHRPRRWNPNEQAWMGHERKRGKLADLNVFLRGGGSDAFSAIVGNTTMLSEVRYVITLDTDTQLPRETAHQLVGAMAHPLNRPRVDPLCAEGDLGRVNEGYGVLQPRIGASLSSTNRSEYARLFGGEAGIDPYTRVVSDVYQDLFYEGSFIGKGIYDIDAFERTLCRRFPENRILSHDLLEGCYVRSGLLSDVQLYEEFPSSYRTDVSRRHRWIRGDWQIATWLLSRVPGPNGGYQRNLLSALSRWKLMDNLRRSVVPVALVLLVLLGWIVLAEPAYWTSVLIFVLATPAVTAVVSELSGKPLEVPWRQHLIISSRTAKRNFGQAIFTLASLPYEAYFSLDAIWRAHVRLFITRRRLLEWNPSHEVERESESAAAKTRRAGISNAFRTMWIAPAIALTAAAAIAVSSPLTLIVAMPLILLWAGFPVLAWWVSRPLPPRTAELNVAQILFLRQVARRTWYFFETFVGPKENWLPPDNFQEHPVATVAHRTSPTNMGLSLLANLAAYDFGYISTGQLLERTANTLRSMETLERHAGHFYNWYDTQTKAPLTRYVSTVDSGNLGGHLLTLRAGLLETIDMPVIREQVFLGMGETFKILQEEAGSAAAPSLAQFEQALVNASGVRPVTIASARADLDWLATCSRDIVCELSAQSGGAGGDAMEWAQALNTQCENALSELIDLLPQSLLSAATADENGATQASRMPSLRQLADQGSALARDWMATIERLASRSGEMAQMKYGFLFNHAQRQLAIGYNVGEHRLDQSYYDLLASEARLCNFVAIAQGELPQESWFALGRLLTTYGGETALLSWTGSMFEYLMPLLVMPTFDNTLLDQTCKAAVKRQIGYGEERGVPWGISESGYNAVDVQFNYQYRAFGVPGLGLKRGLGEDLVVAPYACVLALMVEAEAACDNLQQMAAEGIAGRFGFYEAVDYTPSRLRRGETRAVVRSFMAHHQGMSLLSLAYLLLDKPMQRRFTAEPLFRATMLLLQERIPKASGIRTPAAELPDVKVVKELPEMPVRLLSSANTPVPEVQLLSNGRYHVMVTNAGGGRSRWRDLAVTRWREDSTCDNWGNFCYLRDVATGEFWSNTYQPTCREPKRYGVVFSEGRIEFRRRDLDFDTHTEITVSPEDDIEIRRVRITNRAWTRRSIEITSYAEVVLAPPSADAQAPAFGNLFVQTEILADRHAILCSRRPRSETDQVPWMLHLMTVHGVDTEKVSYETDRKAFIGRGNDVSAPVALTDPTPLSGSAGSVLDPIVAIRKLVTIDPGEAATIDIVTGAGDSRHAVMHLVEKYQDQHLKNRVFDLAWTHSLVVLRQLNATEADAQLYGRLAGSVLYANTFLRAEADVLGKNQRSQSGLWGYAISGDLPIVLLQVSEADSIQLVRQLIQAHAYWRAKGLAVDLVIWNEDHSSYRQVLHDHIMGLVAGSADAHLLDRPGGIFLRRAEQIAAEDRILLQTVARVIILDSKGSLNEQLTRRVPTESPEAPEARPRSLPSRPPVSGQGSPLPQQELLFFNGLGGFTRDGREYVITLEQGQMTPAPWANIIANPHFGTVISESGQAYTWCDNAHEFRLTPWNNDPVCDHGGEAYYLRDEENAYFWSPSPLPKRGATAYVIRHGFGYSAFEHTEGGIRSELLVYVATDAPVKFAVLNVHNESGRPRKLSATGCIEWVLGDLPEKGRMHIVSEIDPDSGVMLARNPYNNEFSSRVAFFDVDDGERSVTGDRTEFIGRNGRLSDPAAMAAKNLSGRVGPGLDPCGAIRVGFELPDGATRQIVFRLGVGTDAGDALKVAQRFRGTRVANEVLEAVRHYWQHTLGAVQVATPDPSVNVMMNGWLVYQVMACRLWGRSGYYQSGGAFGFRDQLQDVMALVHAEPALMREHLLRAASRQFVEGDVQHWWHPPGGRGIRSRCSDDYLWLPLAACRYVATTGDIEVLDESVGYLEGRPVAPDEESYYDLPIHSGQTSTLYEHCVRALVHGLRFGEHGLPLMGTGDWNDGMNLVGFHGRGESVWLAFFLYDILIQFSELATRHGDITFAGRCLEEAGVLQANIEQHAWDGNWYRRAYFDDGTPLGSATNQECRIDSVSQSWSVLSGAAAKERQRQAMESVNQHLVQRDAKLIQLLDPPFDQSPLNPGYIKGYVPGVRENGGQYTHAAVWTSMAFATLGDPKRAWKLLGMINPVNHTRTQEMVSVYKVEPYVVAADVYAVLPHVGRGGWSWYTGSAGWLYRLMLETLLGVTREGGKLHFKPCLPGEWDRFALNYRYGQTTYHIIVLRVEGESKAGIAIDGVDQSNSFVALLDDRVSHTVEVRVGPAGGSG